MIVFLQEFGCRQGIKKTYRSDNHRSEIPYPGKEWKKPKCTGLIIIDLRFLILDQSSSVLTNAFSAISDITKVPTWSLKGEKKTYQCWPIKILHSWKLQSNHQVSRDNYKNNHKLHVTFTNLKNFTSLTPSLPQVTKTEFLLTISI